MQDHSRIRSDSSFLGDLLSGAITPLGSMMDSKTLNDEFKRHKVKRTFQQISQLCIICAIAVVLYYDLLMIWPHLGALFWATTWSIVLAKPHRALLQLRERFDQRFVSIRPYFIAVSLPLYVAVVLGATSSLTILIWTVGFGAVLFLITGAPRMVVAACLVAAVIAVIALPMAVILKTSSDEVNEIVAQIHDFVANNAELRKMMDDLGSSRLFRYVGIRLPEWDAEVIKSHAMQMASMAGSHVSSMLNVSILLVNRTSNAIVSFITFLTFLFYLLTDDPLRFYDGLSPFSEADTRSLLDSLRKSLVRTFVCSAVIALVHGLLTYTSFMICGLPFRLILSALSALLSIMPFIGTWVIWVPVSVGYAIHGQHIKAAVVIITQLFGDLYVDAVVRSYIPGNSYFVGLSVAMGGYVFGPEGVLAGPLLAGVSMTLLDIYKDYTAEPVLNTAVVSESSVSEPVVLLPTTTVREKRKAK